MKGQREPGEKGKGLSLVKRKDWFYWGRKGRKSHGIK